MSMNTVSSTQALVNHFWQQLWLHDWGYILFAGLVIAVNAAATGWIRGSRR